jgi:hypothetical protein
MVLLLKRFANNIYIYIHKKFRVKEVFSNKNYLQQSCIFNASMPDEFVLVLEDASTMASTSSMQRLTMLL